MSMLNHFFDYKPEVLALDEKALELCQPYFKQMEDIRDYNQLKMLKAFADTQMSSTDMLGTTGYGLWDTGRAKLEQIFAEVMGAEDALVRSQFQSGTHTLAVALFGLLRAGDTLLAATGRPYDTLEGVIGLDGKGKGTGTLMDYGIKYDEAPLKADFTPDYELIAQKAPGAKVCHIQRSRGYLSATPSTSTPSARWPTPPVPPTPTSSSLWTTATASSPRRKNPARPVQTSWWAASSRTPAAASPPPAAISRAGRIWWSCVPTA